MHPQRGPSLLSIMSIVDMCCVSITPPPSLSLSLCLCLHAPLPLSPCSLSKRGAWLRSCMSHCLHRFTYFLPFFFPSRTSVSPGHSFIPGGLQKAFFIFVILWFFFIRFFYFLHCLWTLCYFSIFVKLNYIFAWEPSFGTQCTISRSALRSWPLQ